MEIDEIDNHVKIPNNPRTITVKCVRVPCRHRGNLDIKFRRMQTQIQIIFEDMNFSDSVITLLHTNVQFINVTFENVAFRDAPKRFLSRFLFRDLTVSFVAVRLIKSEISFKTHENVLLKMMSCFLFKLKVRVEVQRLFFSVSNSHNALAAESFVLKSRVLHISVFHKFVTHGQVSCVIPVQIVSENVYLDVIDSTVENTCGGFEIHKKFSGNIESNLQITINNSNFVNISKVGSGGAFQLVFEASKSQHLNFLRIENSSFMYTRALQNETTVKGGAVFVGYVQKDLAIKTLFQVQIRFCLFVNNFAEDTGGGLYVSYGSVSLQIFHSVFAVDDPKYVSFRSAFVSAFSDVVVKMPHLDSRCTLKRNPYLISKFPRIP